jgi:crotonobetainyl-CoA:carnitine CoA-transferase CaiB-like acyl-CoA transferase
VAGAAHPGSRTYPCRAGRINVSVENPRQWRGFAVAIGRPELSYEGAWDAVRAAAPDGPLGRVIAGHLAEDDAETWLRRLEAHGVPCRVE